jgi:hypothetical protein
MTPTARTIAEQAEDVLRAITRHGNGRDCESHDCRRVQLQSIADALTAARAEAEAELDEWEASAAKLLQALDDTTARLTVREAERDAARAELMAYAIPFGRLADETAEQHVAAIKACYDAEGERRCAAAKAEGAREALAQAAEKFDKLITGNGQIMIADVVRWLRARAQEGR